MGAMKPAPPGRNQPSDAPPTATSSGPAGGVRRGSDFDRYVEPAMKDVGGPMRGDEFVLALVVSPIGLQSALMPRSIWLSLAVIPILLLVQAAAVTADRHRVRSLLGALPPGFPSAAWFLLPGGYLAARARSLADVHDLLAAAWWVALLVGIGPMALGAFLRLG